jgi:Flp pilus assembly protein CpaB
MQIAEARRLASRPDWLNLRTALGLVLFLMSLFTGSAVLRSAEAGVAVWAAGRDLPEGEPLSPSDLEVVTVRLPHEQLASYLGSATPLDGLVLLRPLRQGELLPAAWVTDDDIGSSRSIAVSLTSDHAVGGALKPGDRVDVFATLRSPRGQTRTTLLIGGAEIEGLLRSDEMLMDGDSFAGITLSVPPEEAAKIAFAVRTADIDVVQVRGTSAASTATSVTAGDL